MLFDSSLRRELAGSFSATLVALVTIVVTITLIRVVGDASRSIFSPADVLVIMAFTVLSDAPTILSLSMFIAVTAVITRMYRDSEMVIWLGTGKNPVGLVGFIARNQVAWRIRPDNKVVVKGEWETSKQRLDAAERVLAELAKLAA